MTKTMMRKAETLETAATFAMAFPSELGWFALCCSDREVNQLFFALPSFEIAIERLGTSSAVKKITKNSQLAELPLWIAELVLDLQSYAGGERVLFDGVPVDVENRTKFQQRVIAECRKIAPGMVKSYGELARLAGSVGAARAVGSVMASNRVPIIIPCHRVVASNGIGGFSAPGGLGTKRKLLELEASWASFRERIDLD